MLKDWAVTFIDTDTRKVDVACFTAANAKAASIDFRDCYRHGMYTILGVAEIPAGDAA
mgnify:CR=1 FL=1